MTITSHYINNNFELKNFILDTIYVHDNHTSINVANHI